MSDPLGFIAGAGATRGMPGYTPGADSPQGDSPAFRDVLLKNLNEVNSLQQDATQAIQDLQTGRRDDLEGVILATQKADTAFRMLQQLRNKMVEAYDEIKQVRV